MDKSGIYSGYIFTGKHLSKVLLVKATVSHRDAANMISTMCVAVYHLCIKVTTVGMMSDGYHTTSPSVNPSTHALFTLSDCLC